MPLDKHEKLNLVEDAFATFHGLVVVVLMII